MRRPEELAEALTAALPQGIRSVLLYGSAAAGDHVGGRSDYNVLVVVDQLTVDTLQAIAAPSRRWQKAGNPAPLLFTPGRLRRSADVFAIEILDIRDQHRVLYGDDAVLDIEVSMDDVRRELERELESSLLRLRQSFLLVADRPAAVWALIEGSLSTFLVLIRAAARLGNGAAPRGKLEAVDVLASRLQFDHQAFVELERLRRGRQRPPAAQIGPWFARYLRAAEQLLQAVDRLDTLPDPGAGPPSP